LSVLKNQHIFTPVLSYRFTLMVSSGLQKANIGQVDLRQDFHVKLSQLHYTEYALELWVLHFILTLCTDSQLPTP
jgi:hypothetical protein